MALPSGPSKRWSLDFVADTFGVSRRFRILAVIDDYTRECLALAANTSLSCGRVARELDAVSQPNFHGALSPDFVVRRADDTYLIIEIECPAKKLMTKNGQATADSTHAEKQVVEYEAFLTGRATEARAHFPGYSRADCLVITGLESELTEKQKRGLRLANGRRQNLRIAGFDWALERGKAIVGNLSDGHIEVVRGHRVI